MKKLLFILLVFVAPSVSNAQFNWGHNYFEVGLGGGIMNYSGELTTTIFDYKHFHPGGALFVRYNVGKFLSLRGQLALGSISGNDADSPDQRNQIRNLSFNSHLFEGSVIVEANLMGYHPRGHQKMFSPYVFVGLGVFNYNPYTTHFDPNLDAQKVFLQALNTEGQGSATFTNRTSYATTQVSIPMGIGFKYAINSNIAIGFEVGFRPTFTDYLDDVGQTYPVNNLTNEPFYDQNAYILGEYGDKSAQELFSDKTYAYIAAQRGETLSQYLNTLVPILDKDPSTITDQSELDMLEEYNGYINARGGSVIRGDKLNDWYVFTMLTVSYNFIENGLVGHRKRRKRKAGCKSSQF
jgi:hypothetical protein